MDESLPSELDVRNAFKKLKCNKEAGVDEIFAEMLKAGLKVHEDKMSSPPISS